MNIMQKKYLIFGIGFLFEGNILPDEKFLGKFECADTEIKYRFILNKTGSPLPITDNSVCNESTGEVIINSETKGNICNATLSMSVGEKLSARLTSTLLNLPAKLIESGGIFLHSSFVISRGHAILFTGEKQIGKSTQATLWEKYGAAKIINGDRTAIRKIEGKWVAFGSPYCGTSGISENGFAEIKCIVILGKDSKNTCRKATCREAFLSLIRGCSFRTENERECSEATSFIKLIAEEVKFLKLDCLPDRESVQITEKMLWE